MEFEITRKIEIDAGHRIPDHKSKCSALHGHRYRIQLSVSSKKLQNIGEESGMVKDFSFLKELLVKNVHNVCDHRMMLYIDDPLVEVFIGSQQRDAVRSILFTRSESLAFYEVISDLNSPVIKTPIVVCAFIPTAENLSKAWFAAIAPGIHEALPDAKHSITVWETPNVTATYHP